MKKSRKVWHSFFAGPVFTWISQVLRKLTWRLIRIYQLAVVPCLPPACRFYPSCSCYTQEAVVKYGVGKGLWLGIKRICRCHPYGGGGYDPLV